MRVGAEESQGREIWVPGTIELQTLRNPWKGKPRVFKTKWFQRFARKEKIADAALLEAVSRAEKGQIDVDLGGGVIKQRVARPGQGKSGGYRTIVLFRRGERAFFVYGFPKSARDNIDESDERGFKELARVLLSASDEALAGLLAKGKYVEVSSDETQQGLQE